MILTNRRLSFAMLAAGLLGLATVTAAPAQERTPVRPPAQSAAEQDKQEKRCVHGCERWGKVCNVDPRGVYKCRRRCEKFGEICE